MFLVVLIFIGSGNPLKDKYQEASKIKDPFKAVEIYRQIIKESPENPYADSSLFRIGMLYYLLGDFEKTIDHFELIFKKGTKSSMFIKTCYWLKYCYGNVGDSTKSKKMEDILLKLVAKEDNKESATTTKETSEKDASKEKDKIKDTKIKSETTEERTGFYTIQIGAYEDKKWLEYFLSKLKENKVEYFVKEEGNYSKIYSGKFENRSEVEKYLEDLKNKGFHGFIAFDSAP
jgi:tetratricopeptide (TPR) repeat protein